ncbi:MauE/DoxX family redox-associated membrane protein [Janibacter sp. GXQ6167]|uniref:MauE/DoxX family redox-associated membrane protein n=1 Tax=Janibacter sp. GXQ6167 TaxID=3240791 RepID=UPI00352356D8
MSVIVWLVVAGVLAVSGTQHIRRPAHASRAVRAHGLVSPSPAAITGLGIAEVALAAGLLGAVVGSWSSAVTASLGGASAAYLLACGAYLFASWRRGAAGLDCGCGLGASLVGGWAITRAVVLGALAGLAAIVTATGSELARPALVAEWAVAVLASAACVGLALLLPAVRVPAEGRKA